MEDMAGEVYGNCTFCSLFSVNLRLVKNTNKIKPIKKRKENIVDFIYFHVSKYSFFDSLHPLQNVKSTLSLFIQK